MCYRYIFFQCTLLNILVFQSQVNEMPKKHFVTSTTKMMRLNSIQRIKRFHIDVRLNIQKVTYIYTYILKKIREVNSRKTERERIPKTNKQTITPTNKKQTTPPKNKNKNGMCILTLGPWLSGCNLRWIKHSHFNQVSTTMWYSTN